METCIIRFRGYFPEGIGDALSDFGLRCIPLSHVYFGKGAFVRYNKETWSDDDGKNFYSKTGVRIIAKSERIAEQIISKLEGALTIKSER